VELRMPELPECSGGQCCPALTDADVRGRDDRRRRVVFAWGLAGHSSPDRTLSSAPSARRPSFSNRRDRLEQR
jgi:hypothetical protein